jgi:transposase-like protein
MHDGARAEPVLAAWGITTAGKPVFVGLAAAGSESTDAWGDFLIDLVERGLRPPLLVVSDGAPGQRLVELAQARIDAFAATWGRSYPAAVKSLLTDRHSLTTYLRFPIEHHKRVRHSDFIERTFGETRRLSSTPLHRPS